MAIKDFVSKWWEKAMTEPEVNSRIVYLLHGLTACVGLVALMVGFIVTKDKAMYPDMVFAVAGGAGLASMGRMFTKFGSKRQDPNATDTPDGGTNGS